MQESLIQRPLIDFLSFLHLWSLQVHVNQTLNILVTGESVLNDAISIVLYNLFISLNTAHVRQSTLYQESQVTSAKPTFYFFPLCSVQLDCTRLSHFQVCLCCFWWSVGTTLLLYLFITIICRAIQSIPSPVTGMAPTKRFIYCLCCN